MSGLYSSAEEPRASLQFGRYSFPVPLRIGGRVDLCDGGLLARKRLPIPVLVAAAGNRTRDR